LVAERLPLVLRYIDPERVQVSPDCGFSQTARSVACRKPASMVKGVQMVRRERKG
jgi:5-methyltetrahydropteroyltriglutamate--homocysteine methyltransferase